MNFHSQEWLDHFIARGYSNVQVIGSGVEGVVHRLGNGQVAKVWFRKSAGDLLAMQQFYADLAEANLSFETPTIVEVSEVAGRAITIEKELAGTPLQNQLAPDDRELLPSTVNCVTSVLRELATVSGTLAMQRAAVLDESESFWAGANGFSEALAALLERRVRKFGHVLQRNVIDFDRKADRIIECISGLEVTEISVIHGDLFGENILVDNSLRPLSVFDFGFLSTCGDPRMDAAITAIIMNMYGPHARSIAQFLTKHFAAELGYSPEILVLYQAAYALATSNIFTNDGNDGHFAWCIKQLNRNDVSEVLGMLGSNGKSCSESSPSSRLPIQ